MEAKSKFVELLPVDDVFVTKLGGVEFPAPGTVRYYFYAKEAGQHVLKLRTIWPLECAIETNNELRKWLMAEFHRLHSLAN